MIKNLFFVLFCTFLLKSFAWEESCIYKSSSGDFYDLSPLSKCDLSGYTVNTDNDGPFVLNICNQVTAGCSRANTAICQSGSYSGGVSTSQTFSDYGGGKGVVLTYSNGDPDGCSGPRKSIITFICNANAPTPKITFVSESPQCTYNFQIESNVACPVAPAEQKELCLINVFLVPHTHDDVGWLQTIEGYYENAVKHILDTTVQALVDNPERKFVYVEQAFFNRWWIDGNTTDKQRQDLMNIYKNGQWEFLIGGWVMEDEACTTYGADIDQLTLGHQFLLNTFGAIPTKGWQLDPFGASSVTPYLEKLAGFDAHLIDRITNKPNYENAKQLQFLWQGVPSQGKKGEIFTEILGGDLYCDWLGAFNFQNDPVNPSNVAQYAQSFANMVQDRIVWYQTPNLLAEWGCDFAFQNAQPMFHSMDQVVNYLQQHVNETHINVKYAVASEYFDSVWKDSADIQYSVNEGGDFFPYFDSLWWTGYYTSRVQLKGFVRRGEAVSHAAEELFSLGRLKETFDTQNAFNQLYTLRVANADAQHHDGVTGTSVPPVVEMYKDDLINGMTSALTSSSNILNLLIQKGNTKGNLVQGTDALLNIKNGQTVAIVLYNSLGWEATQIVKLPVNAQQLSVVDESLNPVVSQVIPVKGGNQTSTYNLYFSATVGYVGYSTYFITSGSSKNQAVFTDHKPIDPVRDTVIGNRYLNVTISSTTGRISSITNIKSGVNLMVDQNLNQYTSQNSGAYAFGPAGPSVPVSNNPPTTVVANGPVVSEIYQTFSSYAKQTIHLYSDNGQADVENYLDIEFDLGPLPSHIEVVALFTSTINNRETIFTDDNGFEFVERSYQWVNGIGANYFPMVYASYISDNFAQITLLSERSHGASTQGQGQIEVMVHRNPDMGDGFGPGLTDTTEVYPSLRVVVDTPVGSRRPLHKQSYLMNFPFHTFSADTTSPSDWKNNFVTSQGFVSAALPPNIHLVSMYALNPQSKQLVMRFTHLYGIDEDPVYSQPTTVDVKALLSNYNIKSFTEFTLTANKALGQSSTTIVLNPKDIRTFVVDFS